MKLLSSSMMMINLEIRNMLGNRVIKHKKSHKKNKIKNYKKNQIQKCQRLKENFQKKKIHQVRQMRENI